MLSVPVFGEVGGLPEGWVMQSLETLGAEQHETYNDRGRA